MIRRRQPRLQLELPPVQRDYGSWVRHANVETACNRLALWQVHGGRLWLYSDSPAGKSHLLQSLQDEQATRWIDLAVESYASINSWQLAQRWMEQIGAAQRWLFDLPAGALPRSVAYALFHILERSRAAGSDLVVAWRGDPTTLPPELSSRLLAMEQLDMAPPDDDESLLEILRHAAANMQWDVREQVLKALLIYLPRRLDLLMAALQQLEKNSLEERHKPGAAWVKQQLLQMQLGDG